MNNAAAYAKRLMAWDGYTFAFATLRAARRYNLIPDELRAYMIKEQQK